MCVNNHLSVPHSRPNAGFYIDSDSLRAPIGLPDVSFVQSQTWPTLLHWNTVKNKVLDRVEK